MKYFIFIIFLMASFSLNAEIVYQRDVKITQINAYDDEPDIAAFIYLSSYPADCPKGVYLNPNSSGFETLYSLVLAAFMAQNTVSFQLYNDRLSYGRCEADAIQVFAR